MEWESFRIVCIIFITKTNMEALISNIKKSTTNSNEQKIIHLLFDNGTLKVLDKPR